ncbi:hypothetical protein CQW23_14724 [Capsicum baccatum]|uniref:Uncharacterized protein n=1 Tax=Capsicum baccatum TaxID=33114 RepID=A0A2G2WJZ2_CAPBA|nr:hypothetical protein CQW23_14724 [Capsicum baccatum]
MRASHVTLSSFANIVSVFMASRLNVYTKGIEDGEDRKSALIRKLRQKTKITSVEIIAKAVKLSSYLNYLRYVGILTLDEAKTTLK